LVGWGVGGVRGGVGGGGDRGRRSGDAHRAC
jgi:hypothetical protein